MTPKCITIGDYITSSVKFDDQNQILTYTLDNMKGACTGNYTYEFQNLFGQIKIVEGSYDLDSRKLSSINKFRVKYYNSPDGRLIP